MPAQIKATDFHQVLECDRIIYLDYHADRDLSLPPSPFDVLLMQQGQAHETAVMHGVEHVRPTYTFADLPAGYRETLALMREGVPVIAQGVLMAGDLVGIPDVLLRSEGPSRLGAHHYRPVDIKLASSARQGYQLQVMAYAALLESIQGVRPEGALWLRRPPAERSDPVDTVEVPVEFDEALYAEVAALIRRRAGGEEPRPYYSSTCKGCGWREVCVPLVRQARDVSLIPGMRRDVWAQLHARGLGKLADLARVTPDDLLDIRGVGLKTAHSLVNQARALDSGEMILLSPPELPVSRHEVFFDIESVPGENIIYLMGLLVRRGDEVRFQYDAAEHPEDERRMWHDFLRRVELLDGPIYHYSSYERTALTRLAEKHGEAERVAPIVGRLKDLEKVVRAHVVLPLTGYSLKDIAPWLGYQWSGDTAHADDSMVEYLKWLEDGDRERLRRILNYNEHDCRATMRVKDWLASLGEG